MIERQIHLTQGSPAIAYESAGRGECLLFLHGIGGNRDNWHEQIASFSGTHRAVSLDFRGYGESEDVEQLEFHDLVEDVERVLDALDVERAHVVGLSLGGLVAQGFYARSRERVRSLTLAACRSAAEPVLPGTRREQFIADRLEPLRAGGPEVLAQSLAPGLIGKCATEHARERVMASLRKLRPESYVRMLGARMRIDPFLDPATIDVPVLVIGSDEDTVAPLSQMRQLAGAIPGARLGVIAGAGHLINIEKPQEFDAALRSFLQEVGS